MLPTALLLLVVVVLATAGADSSGAAGPLTWTDTGQCRHATPADQCAPDNSQRPTSFIAAPSNLAMDCRPQ